MLVKSQMRSVLGGCCIALIMLCTTWVGHSQAAPSSREGARMRLFWPSLVNVQVARVEVTGIAPQHAALAQRVFAPLVGREARADMFALAVAQAEKFIAQAGGSAGATFHVPVEVSDRGKLTVAFYGFPDASDDVVAIGVAENSSPEPASLQDVQIIEELVISVAAGSAPLPEDIARDVRAQLVGAPLSLKAMTKALQYIQGLYHDEGQVLPELKFRMGRVPEGVLELFVSGLPARLPDTSGGAEEKGEIAPPAASAQDVEDTSVESPSEGGAALAPQNVQDAPHRITRPQEDRMRGIILLSEEVRAQLQRQVAPAIPPQKVGVGFVQQAETDEVALAPQAEVPITFTPIEGVRGEEVQTGALDMSEVEDVAVPSLQAVPTPQASRDEVVILTSLGGDRVTPYVFDEQDFLFLEGMVGGIVVADIIEAYYTDGELYLPLSVLARALRYKLQIDPGTGRAEGWFNKVENAFSLRVQPHPVLNIAGESVSVTPEQVRATGQDIYVRTDAFERWFDVGLELDLTDLVLYMTPSGDAPLLAQQARHSLWQKYEKSSVNSSGRADVSLTEVPYQMFGAPTIRLTNSNTFTQAKTGARAASHNVNVQSQGDVAYMTGRTLLNIDKSSAERPRIRDARLTLERRSLAPNLAGPLKATEAQLGDINLDSLPLISGVASGRGVRLTNEPSGYVRDPENFEVRGTGPIGWDVEVYQGSRLLDFQVIDASGEYVFEALPLSTGVNLFRTVLYGPNGEKEERFDKYFLGQGLLKKDQFLYNMGYLQSTDALIPVDGNKVINPDENILSVRTEYGLLKNVSVLSGAYHGVMNGEDVEALSLGLRGTIGNMYLQSNTAQTSLGQGYSVLGRYALEGNASLSAGYNTYTGYDAAVRSEKDNLFVRYDTQFDALIDTPWRLSLEGRKRRYLDAPDETVIQNRLSTRLLGLSVSNDLTYTEYDSTQDSQMLGGLTVRGDVYDYDIRARAGYTLEEERKLQNMSIDAQRRLRDDLVLDFGVARDFTGRTENRYSAGLNWKLNRFEVGLSGEHGSGGDSRVLARIGTTLMPTRDGYKATSSSSAYSEGTLWVSSYLDKNENNIQDTDEQDLEGVSFRNRLRGTEATSDVSGDATIERMAMYVPNTVEVLTNSLPDIYMQPAQEQVHVVGRPGVIGPVKFPIHQLGEINGTVSLISGGDVTLLSEQALLLYNADDEPVTHVYTAYDGFYFFPSLPMGRYKVMIPTDSLLQYGVEKIDPLYVTLTSDNPVIDDLDVVLEESVRTFE